MQKQEMLLVQQGKVCIAAGGVPVLEFAASGWDVCSAVNFLRCGCPAVQLFSRDHLDQRKMAMDELATSVKALALPGERFPVEIKSVHPLVLVVTRHLDPATAAARDAGDEHF